MQARTSPSDEPGAGPRAHGDRGASAEIRDVSGRPERVLMVGDDFARVLASAKAGDGLAFAQLYESMNRRVAAFLAYRGVTDPDGMVSDVFLKVFTKLDTFDGNEIQFAAWIFKIARNTLIDEARFKSRRPDETLLLDSHASSEAIGDVETDAIDRMSTAQVLRQLDCLTAAQRDVVVMRVVSDLTIEAIAEILGMRVGAVKAMQRRALRTLAKKIASETVPR